MFNCRTFNRLLILLQISLWPGLMLVRFLLQHVGYSTTVIYTVSMAAACQLLLNVYAESFDMDVCISWVVPAGAEGYKGFMQITP